MHIRPFEIALIGIFAVAALIGLIFLSMYKGSDDPNAKIYGERVQIWGTFDQNVIDLAMSDIATADKAFSVVRYRQIDAERFESELLNAIAEGSSPDLLLIPHTLLVSLRSKLASIPETTLDRTTFRNTYIDGAEIFMRSDGVYAVPFAVDPLVLYWNRDRFSSAGIAIPPKTWESLVYEAVPLLTTIDERRALTASAIGMGEYLNVRHAGDILSLLFFQSGTSIVEERDGRYIVTLEETKSGGIPPALAALNFYAQFALPGSKAYTWNRTQQYDRNAFTAGTLAMYLGKGSEIRTIEDENPNLNFDVAPVPQAQGVTVQRNAGTFYGFAIPKASPNVSGAYRAALTLTNTTYVASLTRPLSLTPVHRSLYGSSAGAYDRVLEQSALIARGWLDPSPRETQSLMKTMIENITGGRAEAQQTITDAAYSLQSLLR